MRDTQTTKGGISIKQKMIFIVDDNATNLTIAENVLVKQYRVIALSSAAKMFMALEKFRPDLILLDIEMPEMSGFEAIKRLQSNDLHAEIPVIFLSSLSDAVNEAYGIELGAVDFIMKPFSEPVLLNRIKNHLNIDELIRERTLQLAKRTEQLVHLQNGIVFTMADLVESRDINTGGHIDRTTIFIKILIETMLEHKIYDDEMCAWDLDTVVSSARLHDLGKIAISDSILNKSGPLSEEEFQEMKRHTIEGERIIDKTINRTGEMEFLKTAKIFAGYHHERWDGGGYPYGLKEKEIPLHGRIMAVIDVYDALVSERPYKRALTHEAASNIILEESCLHFDPLIAEAFYKSNEKIKAARIKLL